MKSVRKLWKERRRAERQEGGLRLSGSTGLSSDGGGRVGSDPERERWVFLAEMAERVGVCERTLRNWGKSGRVPLKRLGGAAGGRLGMLESDFVRWMGGRLIGEGSIDGQPGA